MFSRVTDNLKTIKKSYDKSYFIFKFLPVEHYIYGNITITSIELNYSKIRKYFTGHCRYKYTKSISKLFSHVKYLKKRSCDLIATW